MTELPVADQVNDYILAECLSILESHPHDPVYLVWLVSIDMEDRCSNGFGYFSTIESCSSIHGSSGETNLVITNDMDIPPEE